MKRLFNMSFLFLLFITYQAHATPMLSGAVSFDDASDLYTYTYTLDTTEFIGNITIVDVWQNVGFYFEGPYPVSHTEPVGWQFVLSVGSVGNQPFGSPENITGSFWSWWLNPGDLIPNDIQTFSFTTERGASTLLANNYGLYNNSLIVPTGYIEVGHIVGPELVNVNYPISTIPENETYIMMLAGLGLMGFIMRRTSKSDTSKSDTSKSDTSKNYT